MPPLHDIAHLAHLELRTPVLDESVAFFTDYLGLTVTEAVGDSVFLRAFDDYEQTTIKLTAHGTSGICTAGARLVLAPDWEPVDWTEAERAKGQAWGLQTIESFHTHGTPPVVTP